MKPQWGFWAIAVGFLMLAGVMGITGWGVWGSNRGCPDDFVAGPPDASAWVYAAEGSIKLGRPACLNLKPAIFFRSERAALKQQTDAIAAAKTSLDSSGRTVADPKVVAAATTKLAQAQAALAQLPRRRKVFLFLDDVKVPIEGREVDVMAGSPDRPWVPVDMLLRGADDAASEDGRTWRRILGGPTQLGERKVRISVAVAEADDKPPVVRAVLGPQATLQVFDFWRLLFGGLGLALLAAGIVKRGWNTGLLRDGGPSSAFSLGRVQMAWWLVLMVGGFLFIWLVSGQWKGVVTSGVVALLGISATTGVAARLVDTRAGTTHDSSSPPGGPLSVTDASNGFWRDIVDDGDGAGLHRIQLIAWTLLLGAVFIWTVVWTFGFPDFDTNLLLLAGLAGGTYLGFKFQEPDSPGGTRSPP
jgi:hypothetical protein